ncbi:MAG: hypothetical protein KA383_18535 [Phycisphaerae bacterium]|nr:hypothetical protein [Phycisphaerae bacterium]
MLTLIPETWCLAADETGTEELLKLGFGILILVLAALAQHWKSGKKERSQPAPTRPAPLPRPRQPKPTPREAEAELMVTVPLPPRPPMPRPPIARPAPPTRPQAEPTIEVYTPERLRRSVRQRKVQQVMPEAPPVPIASAATLVARPAPKPTAPVPTGSHQQLLHMLRNRTDLRTAFVLSEILAPPVALREDRPR